MPDAALLELLRRLAASGYRFVTPTPLTHARVLARPHRQCARNLADIFGWSLPFDAAVAGPEWLGLMRDADVLQEEGDGASYRSRIRVSSLHGALYAHSAYPTHDADAVFFGPDTYRFADFARAHRPVPVNGRALRCVDIGCGSGAGALAVAQVLPDSHWLLTDINPAALRLARVNAALAGIGVEAVLSDVLSATQGGFDLVLCNPPYLADPQQRAYRHGGAARGLELGLRIVSEACARLNPGGRLLLYTGVAIVDGEDPLLSRLRALLRPAHWRWHYAELDPDVFGEELEGAGYADADRIAAVGVVIDRRVDGGPGFDAPAFPEPR